MTRQRHQRQRHQWRARVCSRAGGINLVTVALAAGAGESSREPLTLRRRRSLLSNRHDQSGSETGISRQALAHRFVGWIRGGSSAHAEDIAGDPVQLWKAAWRVGAEARWNTVPLSANPYQYQPGSRPAKAWRAGWQWAEQQPDRRRAARDRKSTRLNSSHSQI